MGWGWAGGEGGSKEGGRGACRGAGVHCCLPRDSADSARRQLASFLVGDLVYTSEAERAAADKEWRRRQAERKAGANSDDCTVC